MSYNLVIVESPNKIKHVKGYLEALYPREKWEVAASVGHFTELSRQTGSGYVTAGVFATTYLPENEVSESKVQVFKKLKALAKDAGTVYLATDADREGEAIAEQLQTWLRLKSPVRVLYNEITKSGIKAAHDNPAGRLNMNLVTAQRARRVLDRMVGFMVSPELYRILNRTGSSAGRVQSPVLRLIDDRKQAIINFKANDYFDVIMAGDCQEKPFKAKFNSKPFQDEHGYFTNRELAEKVAALRDLQLDEFKEGERLKHPPSALTTSLMQQSASAVLKIKPREAMQAAQALFEAGLITYHRTDNPNISEETYEQIKSTFYELGVMPNQRTFKSAEGAQEGHPAITPTDLTLEIAGSTDVERKIYELIRLHAIGSQLLPAKYKERKAVLSGVVDGETVHFNASGRELVDPGYLTWLKKVEVKEEGELEEESALLPNLQEGYTIAAGEVQAKQTKPPRLYTIKTLLAKLADLGIGRPATLDSIFETLEHRKYIVIDAKNQLTSTEHGEQILKNLVGRFKFIEYDFTGEMENLLDLLASGEADYNQVMRSFHNQLDSELKGLATVETTGEVTLCPSCKHPLKNIVKKGEYNFFVCSNTGCDFKADNEGGKPVQRQKPVVSTEHLCPECNEGLIHRHKPGSFDFWGCSGYPKCKFSAPNVNGAPGEKEEAKFFCQDKACGKPLARRTKAASKGQKGYDFWGCTGFRDGCKSSYPVDNDGNPVF